MDQASASGKPAGQVSSPILDRLVEQLPEGAPAGSVSTPYTFIVPALLILNSGVMAVLRTSTDISNIRIPVIADVWQYAGFTPDQMTGRVTSRHQRVLTTTGTQHPIRGRPARACR